MEHIRMVFGILGELWRIGLRRVELAERWDTFNGWRKQRQNGKLMAAIGIFVLSAFILAVYACSKRPDV